MVLRIGMSAKDRKHAHTALNVSDDDERLIVVTGRYIGDVLVIDSVDSTVSVLARRTGIAATKVLFYDILGIWDECLIRAAPHLTLGLLPQIPFAHSLEQAGE